MLIIVAGVLIFMMLSSIIGFIVSIATLDIRGVLGSVITMIFFLIILCIVGAVA